MSFFRKMVAVIVCFAMLATGCALAESTELTIDNIKLSVGDQTLDFSGVGLTFGYGSTDTAEGAMLGISSNGEKLIDAVAAFDEEKVTLSMTGLTNSYAIPYEYILKQMEAAGVDLGQIQQSLDMTNGFDTAMFDQLLADYETLITESITDVGVEEIDGKSFEHYTVDIPAEKMDAFMQSIMKMLDANPALVANTTFDGDYSSFSEAYAAEQVSVSTKGDVYVAETETQIDLTMDVNAQGQSDKIEMIGGSETQADDTTGGSVKTLNFDFYETGSEESIMNVNATVGLTATDEFGSAEFVITAGDDGVMIDLLSPDYQGDGLWEFVVRSMSDSTAFQLDVGTTTAGKDLFEIVVSDTTGVIVDVVYTGADGKGNISITAPSGNDMMVISADTTVVTGDAAWLYGMAEAVDASKLSADEIQELVQQLQAVASSALMKLASTNETIGALLSAQTAEPAQAAQSEQPEETAQAAQ